MDGAIEATAKWIYESWAAGGWGSAPLFRQEQARREAEELLASIRAAGFAVIKEGQDAHSAV